MKKAVAVFVFVIAALGVVIGAAVYHLKTSEEVAQDYDINSYSIAYYANDEIVFQNYGDGINEQSVFELASNGKTVSAYIALQMVEEGKIHLDDKIAPYLDDDLLTDDERINDITLKQLLCHTAGFSPSYELGIDKKYIRIPVKNFVIPASDIFTCKT